MSNVNRQPSTDGWDGGGYKPTWEAKTTECERQRTRPGSAPSQLQQQQGVRGVGLNINNFGQVLRLSSQARQGIRFGLLGVSDFRFPRVGRSGVHMLLGRPGLVWPVLLPRPAAVEMAASTEGN